nr:immunoglobulin heavy chain junction region [Macaca mulatta]MOV46215.1 immunoglobulin heavy chain junction region [Macaca mulatta]
CATGYTGTWIAWYLDIW